MSGFWSHYVLKSVIDAGSMTVAAQKIGLTQPAASQTVKGLNAHYGTVLAERAGTRFAPTGAGEIVLARTQAALSFLREGLREGAGASVSMPQLIRMLSSRRLEALIGVVRHGGFAAAAKAAGVSAPTLHRAAKDVEAALDVTLFEQTSYGVKPTRRAELLADRASLAFAELAQARAEVFALLGKEAGSTTIGAMPLARSHLVPAAVTAFSKAYPGHLVSILEGPYEDLLASLRRGEADILVGALRGDERAGDVAEERLFDDPLAVIMRADHPAARASKLTLKMLASYPWIAPRRSSPLRAQFEALFTGAPPDDLVECNSLGAARVILMESNRLMLLSDAQIRYEKGAGMLVSRPHPQGAARAIGLTFRRGWRPTATQGDMVNRLRAQAP